MILILMVGGILVPRGAEGQPSRPAPRDKCPVCGMFVAKYPEWLGQIVFRDGSVLFFDGAKDLFKCYFNLERYAPGQSRESIAGMFVTEYYDLEPINAAQARFVIGSDVYGPMGRELIPLKNSADAAQFMADHQGQQIVGFAEITPELIKRLDE